MADGCRREIAFVVVTYNSATAVRKCIESIVTHALPQEPLKTIIVVDNASTDGTAAVLAELKATVPGLRVTLHDRNSGFGAANNTGCAEVPARYYVLLNPDAWLLADSVSPALALLGRESAVAVCGLPLVYPDGSPQTHAYRFSSWKKWLLQLLGVRALAAGLARNRGLAALLSRCRFGRDFALLHARAPIDLERIEPGEYTGASRPAEWVCGAAMVVDGDFIRDSGGFDQLMFLYGEDEDLCIQAHRRGRGVVVVDAPPVAHVLGWGANRSDRTAADGKFLSLQYFIRKNVPGSVDRLMMSLLLPLHVYGYRSFCRAWRPGRNRNP
jgi:hypothetical protein